jgi:hypothetical protein
MADDQSKLNPELVEWLNERQRSLEIVKTTRTRGGMLLDWIPLESQVEGGKIATPRPARAIVESPVRGKTQRATFELDSPEAERGPDGTVPILRPDISGLTERVRVEDYLNKRGGRNLRRRRTKDDAIDPDPAGYFHNKDVQDGEFFGWSGVFNVWAPAINVPSGHTDHSILQAWLLNERGVTQTLEGGWTVDKVLNGDLSPHVFTYYTTNNYAKDGNNLGGYNRQHKGWVQYSGPATTGRTLYPGIAITSVSVFDGPQFEMPMQFLLYIDPVTQEGNWWVYVDGIPMGYYPASLYGAGGMSANTTAILSGGEVASALKNPALTQDQMGSGFVAAAGFGRAAYVHNLQVQTDLNGTMVDNVGDPENDIAVAAGADPYSIALNPAPPPEPGWGQFYFVGGPSNVSLATWLVDNVPLPKGMWDGVEWSKQHSRSSNDRYLLPPAGADAIKFSVTGTPQNVSEISFDVAIDRSCSDKTCWSGIGDGTEVGVAASLAHVGMTLAKANERGFYICKVKGATQPFEVTVAIDE